MLAEEHDQVKDFVSKDTNSNDPKHEKSKMTSDLIRFRSCESKKSRLKTGRGEVRLNSEGHQVSTSKVNISDANTKHENNIKTVYSSCDSEPSASVVQTTDADTHKNAPISETNGLHRVPLLVWRKGLFSICQSEKIEPQECAMAQRSVVVTLCTAVMGLCGVLAMLPPVTGFVPHFIEWGYCSEVHLQQDFDPVKYEGWWWDIYRVPNSYEGVDKCIHQNITLKNDVLVVDMEGLSNTGQLSSKTAYVSTDTAASQRDLARRTVDADGVPSAPYLVVATDYLEYSCVYSCLQFPGVFAEFFWIFGRQPTLDEKYSEECVRQFRLAGVRPEKLVKVAQGEECPYSPHLPAMRRTNQQILQDVQRDEKTEKLLSYSSLSTADSAFLREDKNAASKVSLWLGGWSILVTAALLSWTQIRCGSLCS